MNDKLVADLAGKLAVYHRASYRARRHQLSEANIEPQLCGELRNLEIRLTASYSDDHKAVNAIALDDVISRGRQEIHEIASDARQASNAAAYLERAKTIKTELEAALKLLRMLNA